METLAHQLESLLDQVRAGVRPVNTGLIDLLLDAKTLLEHMVDEVASGGPIRTRIAPMLQAIAALQHGMVPATSVPPPASPLPGAAVPVPGGTDQSVPSSEVDSRPRPSLAGETIRIPIDKLDDVLNTASEVFITRIRLQNDVTAIRSALQQLQPTLHRMHALDVNAILTRLADANHRLSKDLWTLTRRQNGHLTPDRLIALVQRFYNEVQADIARQSYATPEEVTWHVLAMDESHKRLQKNVEHLEQLSARLQTGAMSFRMVPMAHLFNRFPTEVREIGRQMGKKVRLDISGADTELDKVLINQLADPLLHILRNAIDHGLEAPAERLALGKPETGRIMLRAYYQGSHVVIEVTDDDRGIHTDRVLARAVERGVVEPERTATMTRQEIFALLCEPGFSTADTVSTVSGRGVGMDVVKSTMAQLQGTLTIDSTPQQGTTIRMHMPLTLAVVGILLVEERFNQFAFPILHVEEILLLDKQDITQISANTVYNYRGTALPLTTLSSLLDFPPSAFADEHVFLVILAEGEKKIGVLVDRVVGRQEVLIKSLGSLIKKVPYVMGCTILSDSRLVLILNAWEIVNARGGSRPLLPAFGHRDGLRSARLRHTVLIVDDSAVQRNNLCAILSHAGYTVETADNGFEGLKRVRHKLYAACCVDIVMPLMDGFEFVERLRHLAGYDQIPVCFITTRTAQVERDRAASLGVRDFFAKPVEADRLVATLDTYCLHARATATEGARDDERSRSHCPLHRERTVSPVPGGGVCAHPGHRYRHGARAHRPGLCRVSSENGSPAV